MDLLHKVKDKANNPRNEEGNSKINSNEISLNYEQLVKSMPVAVYICDTEGNILLYNEQAVEIWGKAPEKGKDSGSDGIMLK